MSFSPFAAPSPAGGVPPSIQIARRPAPSDGPDNQNAAKTLQIAEAAIHQFIGVEQDAQDKQTALKALAILQSISAGRQKENDQAIGMTPQLKAVQRVAQR